jgi:lactoylglutathione lyase
MPHILGLRTTIYKVDDITRAKAWYSWAFGVIPYFDEPYYVGFSVGGYELGIQAEDAPKWENIVTFWWVDDVESASAHFLTCGATEVEKPMNVGGEIMVATVKDPWDNLIGLIYNPTFQVKN